MISHGGCFEDLLICVTYIVMDCSLSTVKAGFGILVNELITGNSDDGLFFSDSWTILLILECLLRGQY